MSAPSLQELKATAAGEHPYGDRFSVSEDEPGELVGKVCVSVEVKRQDDDRILFVFSDGTIAKMYHSQDCCESVNIEDINGELEDLIGVPLLVFDVRTNNEPKTDEDGWTDESGTWTFYTLRTIRGSVDIRWYGSSNGYYSESVNFWSATPKVPLTAHEQIGLMREAIAERVAS